jgi:NAD(P)H-quinone oxidoreductase subunit 5
MHLIILLLWMVAPVVWVLALAVPPVWANRHPRVLGSVLETASVLAGLVVLTVAGIGLSAGSIPLSLTWHRWTIFHLDALSLLLAGLIAFIAWVIVRYSRNYLEGDPRQGEFLQWLGATLASVFVLVSAGHVGLLLAAWISTSLSLHHLLAFYRDRPAAQLSARKKFVFSRMADACLLAAAGLLFQQFQTLDMATLLDRARDLPSAPIGSTLWLAALFLALGAILKSAQFPFHTWLPDTLETPTPVSALMHAGIISAGGFLLIRLSPIMALAPEVLTLLAIVGTITALFGSLVMITQTSIKKALAFSTVAQMGYMMLQCGLGAFALATLHLLAHSLYKAHAFLASGQTVAQSAPTSFTPQSKAGTSMLRLVLALLMGVLISVTVGHLLGNSLVLDPGLFVLGSVLAMALTTLLWTSRTGHPGLYARSVVVSVAVATLYFTLHHAITALLRDLVPPAPVLADAYQLGVMAAITTSFFLVFLLQARLPDWQHAPWCQRLYVLIFNRFYVNALVNRLLLRFWPLPQKP